MTFLQTLREIALWHVKKGVNLTGFFFKFLCKDIRAVEDTIFIEVPPR